MKKWRVIAYKYCHFFRRVRSAAHQSINLACKQNLIKASIFL